MSTSDSASTIKWQHIESALYGHPACDLDEQSWPCDAEQQRLRAEKFRRELVHLRHCNFGEWPGTCKYGPEADCPALTEWSWLPGAYARSALEASAVPTEPVVEYGFCGSLQWTVEKWGRVTHKHSCPNRTDPFCQTHPENCPASAVPEPTEPRNTEELRAYLRAWLDREDWKGPFSNEDGAFVEGVGRLAATPPGPHTSREPRARDLPHPWTPGPCNDCDAWIDTHRNDGTHERCVICGQDDDSIEDAIHRAEPTREAE
jgi:hypothetical protein